MLTSSEEIRKEKAKQLRYKKPIARHVNLDFIKQDLWDIQEACDEVRWYTDADDDSLVQALCGDEDEAYEFRMAFADLCAETERMLEDLDWEYVPGCFDLFFVAAGADDLLGWDSYEGDYYGITSYESGLAREDACDKLKCLSKAELVEASRQCFKIFQAYIGLRSRYDSLKAGIDILREQNGGYLKVVKEIDKLYEAAARQQDRYAEYSAEWREFERFTDCLPQEAWIA